MTITGGPALSKDEIDRMVKDSEAFATEGHSRRETAEARNQADQLAYTVDKSLEEWGDKVPEGDRDDLKKKNDELKEVLKAEDSDADRIRSVTDAAMQVFQRIGQGMYQQAQQTQEASEPAASATGGGSTAESTSGGEDEVVEGEIVDEGGAS